MTTKRKKTPVNTPPTRKEANEVFNKYAKASADLSVLQANLEKEIAAIREEYEPRISQLTEEADKHYERLQLFAEKNEELFDKNRSIKMTHGQIGFRLGTPALKTEKGFTWAAVAKLVEDKIPDYLKVTKSVDRKKIISDREKLGDLLEKVGCKVVQTETFFVKLKDEEVD